MLTVLLPVPVLVWVVVNSGCLSREGPAERAERSVEQRGLLPRRARGLGCWTCRRRSGGDTGGVEELAGVLQEKWADLDVWASRREAEPAWTLS